MTWWHHHYTSRGSVMTCCDPVKMPKESVHQCGLYRKNSAYHTHLPLVLSATLHRLALPSWLIHLALFLCSSHSDYLACPSFIFAVAGVGRLGKVCLPGLAYSQAAEVSPPWSRGLLEKSHWMPKSYHTILYFYFFFKPQLEAAAPQMSINILSKLGGALKGLWAPTCA